jgi:hypothetical protein
MITRITASLVLLLAATFAVQESLARSGGGFGGGRAAAPPAALHPAGLPIRSRATAGAHAFGTPLLRRQRFGSGWSGAWVGGGDYYPYGSSSYPYYDTSGYGAPYEPPPSPYPSAGYYGTANRAPVSQHPVYLVPYHPGCDSQTQVLPWRNDAERSITIVRC